MPSERGAPAKQIMTSKGDGDACNVVEEYGVRRSGDKEIPVPSRDREVRVTVRALALTAPNVHGAEGLGETCRAS